MLKIGQKIKYQGRDGTLTAFFEDTAYIKLKYARAEEMVAISDLEIIEEPIKPKVDKLSNKERGEILTRLVEEKSIKLNFKKEWAILCKLVKKFPHLGFWREGFKPALKVESLAYWYNRPEVEQLYKTWAINLESKHEEIVLEKEKIGTDIHVEKKCKNLLDLLG